MVPYVACHIGLLGLKSRIHNVYTVPCGTEKKPKARGRNGVRGSFWPSPLLPTIVLPFVPLSSIMDPAVLQTMRPTVCAQSRQKFSAGGAKQNKSVPARSIHVARAGKKTRVSALPCYTGIHLSGLFSFTPLPKDEKLLLVKLLGVPNWGHCPQKEAVSSGPMVSLEGPTDGQ